MTFTGPTHGPEFWKTCGLSDPSMRTTRNCWPWWTARKLGAMADADFLAAAFVPAYPVEYSEDETGGFAYGK